MISPHPPVLGAVSAPSEDLVVCDQAPVIDTSIFAAWAPIYREAGFNPLPIAPSHKACHMPNWQVPMSDAAFNDSLIAYADFGIGLLMGSPFPDGTTLAALDVDDDDYIEISKTLLGNPPCIRRGARGVGIFVRVRGAVSNCDFKARGTKKKHSELFTERKLLVIPPTMHPDTHQPYEWLTPSLLDVDFNDLPILEA